MVLRADHGTKIVSDSKQSYKKNYKFNFIYRATLIIMLVFSKSTNIINFVSIKQRGILKKKEKKIKHMY